MESRADQIERETLPLRAFQREADEISRLILETDLDPVAVDAAGSRLLGHDPRHIEYLKLAEGRLGRME